MEVVAYDPDWPNRFVEERDALFVTLEPWLAGEIEHVGSTAVPGLAAKPVIDIMVPVESLEESRPAIRLLEERHGYFHSAYKQDVMHWLGKPSQFVRTHHVHMVPSDSSLFQERLRFRDMLRADSSLRRRYESLKRRLASEFSKDREAYTRAKGPFIASALSSTGVD
ncbi:MAG: GrpB family protein [Myxococcota bacterium]